MKENYISADSSVQGDSHYLAVSMYLHSQSLRLHPEIAVIMFDEL